MQDSDGQKSPVKRDSSLKAEVQRFFSPGTLYVTQSISLILFYILALIFLPGLYSAAYRTAFLAGPADEDVFLALHVSCGCLLFVSSAFSFVCVFVSGQLFVFILCFFCDPP